MTLLVTVETGQMTQVLASRTGLGETLIHLPEEGGGLEAIVYFFD